MAPRGRAYRRLELEVPEWMIWCLIVFWLAVIAGVALLIR